MNLSEYIRNIEDFPKVGVHFKDITPLLANSDAMESCLQQMMALVGDQKIDKVAAI